jgi:hypothetical protein
VRHVLQENGGMEVRLVNSDAVFSGLFLQPIWLPGKGGYQDDEELLEEQKFYAIPPNRFQYGYCKHLDDEGNIKFLRKLPSHFWHYEYDKPPPSSHKLFKTISELQRLQEDMNCDFRPVGVRERVNVKEQFKAFFDVLNA